MYRSNLSSYRSIILQLNICKGFDLCYNLQSIDSTEIYSLFPCSGEIQRLAGDPTLQYLIRMAEGHLDYLCRMPDSVLENIICFLELEDIVRLGITSKRFRRVRYTLNSYLIDYTIISFIDYYHQSLGQLSPMLSYSNHIIPAVYILTIVNSDMFEFDNICKNGSI